jgi:hypothetical protein
LHDIASIFNEVQSPSEPNKTTTTTTPNKTIPPNTTTESLCDDEDDASTTSEITPREMRAKWLCGGNSGVGVCVCVCVFVLMLFVVCCLFSCGCCILLLYFVGVCSNNNKYKGLEKALLESPESMLQFNIDTVAMLIMKVCGCECECVIVSVSV